MLTIFTVRNRNIVNRSIVNFKQITRNNSRKIAKELIQNSDMIDDKFKNNFNNFLRENNIKNFNVEIKYNHDTYDYIGIMDAKYFTDNDINKNNNILDYYVYVCNENKN